MGLESAVLKVLGGAPMLNGTTVSRNSRDAAVVEQDQEDGCIARINFISGCDNKGYVP